MQTNSTSHHDNVNAENVQIGNPTEVVDRKMMINTCQGTFSQFNERSTNNKQASSKEGKNAKLIELFNNK